MFLLIVFSFLMGVIGIVLFIKQYQDSRRIILGYHAPKHAIIKTAFMNGLAVNLSFLSLGLFLAGLEDHSTRSIESILVLIVISIVGNIIVTLGSFWRFLVIGKYRGFLNRKLYKKPDEDELS